VPQGQELALIERLQADLDVEYAEPNYVYHAFVSPDDPYYGNQWAHTRMQSPAAWDIITGTTTVVIAILDSGIDETHPDLATKIVAGYDYVDNDTNPHDLHGHGTHVAGIAAAATNNGVGVAGMNWLARIMPVRVLNQQGSGSSAGITDGITWAYQHGAKVLSLSLGGPTRSQSMQDAIDAAYAAGSLVVAAMGNANNSALAYPAAYNNVMAVSATGPTDSKASYSNYGSHCDIAAPGGDMSDLHDPAGILSTMPTYGVWMTNNSPYYSTNYDYLNGTSQATPYVSGLASLIWSVNSTLTPAQVQNIIQSAAVDLGTSGWDQYYGWGRINALAAVQAARATLGPDLELVKQAVGSIDLQPGDAVTFALAVRNLGGDPATGVVVTDTLSTYILTPTWSASASLTGTVAVSGTQYVWTLPDLAGGTSGVITVTGTISPSIPPESALTNTASGSMGAAESNRGNNGSTAVVLVDALHTYLPLVTRSHVGVTQPPSSIATPGFWKSTTGDEFYVTPDQAYVDNFAIYVTVQNCGNFKITHTAPLAIASNQFSFTGSFWASGTFDSATAAHGQDGLNAYYIAACGKSVSGGPWSWTATWQNSSQPTFQQVWVVEPDSAVPTTDIGAYHVVSVMR
jgi:thermitase